MFPLQTHLEMLADKQRVDLFRQAIMETVTRGDVVVDIGTGTGILAFFAVQAGARMVYALECGPIIDVARKTARENGLEDHIRFIAENSMNADLPEPADVIVTETIGCFAFDEGITGIIADARRRFLKSGGRILPRRLNLWAVPVQFGGRHPWGLLESGFYGFRHQHIQELAANTVFSLNWSDLEDICLLSRPELMLAIDLHRCKPLSYPMHLSAECNLSDDGRFHGMLVYPEIELTQDLSIRLQEGDQFRPTHWKFTFFPNRSPLKVSDSDILSIKLTVTAGNGFAWRHTLRRNSQVQVYSHLSLFGAPSLSHLKPQ